mgnify:CR=1 FL=1
MQGKKAPNFSFPLLFFFCLPKKKNKGRRRTKQRKKKKKRKKKKRECVQGKKAPNFSFSPPFFLLSSSFPSFFFFFFFFFLHTYAAAAANDVSRPVGGLDDELLLGQLAQHLADNLADALQRLEVILGLVKLPLLLRVLCPLCTNQNKKKE